MSSKRKFRRNFQLCNHCPFRTKYKFFMVEHVRNHENGAKSFNCDAKLEIYQCISCDYETENLIVMKEHIEEIHINKSVCPELEVETLSQYFFCRYCEFQTYSILNWYKHAFDNCPSRKDSNLIQNKSKEFLKHKAKCFDQCNFKSHNLDLKKHKLNDCLKVNKRFQCEHCDYETKWKGSFKNHVTGQHLKDQIQWFKCGQCDYKSKWKSHLKQHDMSQHFKNDEIRWIKCEQCDYQTKWKSSFIRHVKGQHFKEEESKLFLCKQCDYKTKWKHYLKEHVSALHLKEGEIIWFKCEQCDYKSKWKQHLKRHVKHQHLKENEIKWFKCEQCDVKTKSKANLARHATYQHSKDDEIKWFKCEQCNFKTKRKDNLRQHSTTQHLKKK